MRLALDVVGAPEAAAGIEQGYLRMYTAASKKMGVSMLGLRNYVVTQHLHGPTGDTTLQQRSGNLARNVASETREEGDSVIGLVGIPEANTAPYARILHEGGSTRAHVIEAREAQALAFMAGGQMIFRRKVNHPGSNFRSRPYLTASLIEERDQIAADLKAAMLESTT